MNARTVRSLLAWSVVAAFGLLVLAAALLAGAHAAKASGAGDQEMTDAIEFRVKYGFDSDPSYVAKLNSDPDASREFGVALSPAELKEMNRRGDIQLSLGPLTEALERDPSFAGLYIDQAAGAVLDIATTGDLGSLQRVVESLAPRGAAVRLHHEAYSMEELKDLQAKVVSDLPKWADSRVQVATVGVDVKANRLRIEVPDLTEEQARLLRQSYDDRVEIVNGELAKTGACNNRSDCGAPLKGGLAIDSSNGWTCTSGFLGRKPANLDHMYLMLAGHCLQDSGLAANWSHHSVVFGHGTSEDYYNGSDADVGIIDMWEPSSKNKLYASSNVDIRSVDGSLTLAQQGLGATVCRVGRNSGYKCGSVSQIDTTVSVSGVLIDHMYKTDYASGGGDSGGSMFYGTKAAGIFSAFGSNFSWYSTTTWMLSEIGVRPCYSSLCN